MAGKRRLVFSDSEREKMYGDVDCLVDAIADMAKSGKATQKERNAVRNAIMGVILKTLALVERKIGEQEDE